VVYLFNICISIHNYFYPGWRVDDAAFFLYRLKNNLFGNAIGGFSLSNLSGKFIPFYHSATNGTTSYFVITEIV